MQFKIFILLGLLSLLASAQSVTQTEAYRKWMRLPSDSLIAMGSKYAEVQNKPDSGLICFTIAASRYKPEMSKQEKRSCAQGYIGKWFVYFFCYFDHSQAFENLLHAQEITQSIGEGVGRVYLNFGCTYQTLSEQSGDLRPDSLALDYYQKSYWQSKHEGDTVVKEFCGEADASSGNFSEEELTFAPGRHKVRFLYEKMLQQPKGDDRVVVSELALHMTGNSAVQSVSANAQVVKTEVYSVAGHRLSQPQQGVNIIRETLSDGTQRTTKILVK